MKNFQFLPNAPDALHCFQCCFSMVLEALTQEQISMELAEELTNFRPGVPTWPHQGMLSWADRGMFVRYVEDFSFADFAEDPVKAIRNHASDLSIAEAIIRITDVAKESMIAKECLKHPLISFEQRKPTLKDIEHYAQDPQSKVVVNVNSRKLNGLEGYSGHFVVVDSVADASVILQNPGPPAQEDQEVSVELFMDAWHFPDDKNANFIAVTYPTAFGVPLW